MNLFKLGYEQHRIQKCAKEAKEHCNNSIPNCGISLIQTIKDHEWTVNSKVQTAEQERHHDGAEHADHHDRGEVGGEV